MEEEDRQRIISNLVELVEQTNLNTLIPELLERRVFTYEMIHKYVENNTELNIRKRQLFLDLQTRGPEAFQNFIDSLMVTGHLDLVQRLLPGVDIRSYFVERVPGAVPQVRQGTNLTTLPRYMLEADTELTPGIQTSALQSLVRTLYVSREPLEVVVRRATVRKDLCTREGLQVYPMHSKPRGYCFIINNVQFINNIERTRTGAEVDGKNLHDLFEQFGYIVESHRDQGLEDMKRKIREFVKGREHSRYDSCVVAIMSHGREGLCKQDSTIVTAEGQELKIEWVLEQFNNENAPSLRRKPKIFFFQTCRGDASDFGVRLTSGRIQRDGSASVILPTMSDILIGYSTLPGFISNRDVYLGTWYIQAICEVFMEHAWDTDIEDMLKMVQHKLDKLVAEDGSVQTASYENRGFRKFFFNPGLFDDPSGDADPVTS